MHIRRLNLTGLFFL